MILEKEIDVKYSSRTFGYYESLGYKYNRYKDKSGVMRIKKGTTIKVKINDLTKGSNVRLTKICDICGKHVENQKYCEILICRNNNEDGIDLCLECMMREKGIRLGIVNENECIANKSPEFAKLFCNKEDTYKHSCNSGKKTDFKCINCGYILKQRIISNIFRQGLSCPICSDDIPYPEKFMISVLNQLKVKFEYQKLFKDWFSGKSKKYYDFYIPSLNCIIETNGMQHYNGDGFKVYGENARTVNEEKENDIYKQNTAIENDIETYIVIDSRYSQFGYIKNSIINSKLNNMFDLSLINWELCHQDACKTIVKTVCELWTEHRNITKVGRIMQIDRHTVKKYLKQGSALDWCDYNSEKNKKKAIAVVQLTLNSEFLNEFRSLMEASDYIGTSTGTISTACQKGWTSYGYKWMYKDDYDEYLEQVNNEYSLSEEVN